MTGLGVSEVAAWERRSGEPPRAYAAFRVYRDLACAQRNLGAVAEAMGGSLRRAQQWAAAWDWRERADAWDDACHRVEDAERLDAIRSMHAVHRAAGREAMAKALAALDSLDPESMSAGTIARLMELGAKLERSTLIVSVEELQGVEVDEDGEDPWERIAAELDVPTAAADL